MAAKAAPSALVVATRAADGGCSPGHVSAPQRPTGTEDGQDRGGARDELHGHAPEDAHPHAAGTQYFAMDVDDVPAAGGSRPDRLFAVSGPQERVHRRTVQQTVDYPSLPILDDPVPLMVGQVIEVPKIQRSSRWSYRRFVDSLRQPQTVEQLVDVPTIISCSSLQRAVEQNVDIPAVGGSGTGGGLSGFLPGQSYSMTAEQIVDNPVPRPGGAGDLQGFPRGQGSTALSEQIPEFPDPGGGREDFQPVHGSAVSSSDSLGQAGQGFFSHRRFPGFTVVVVSFVRQNPRRFPRFCFRNVFYRRKSSSNFGRSPNFPKNSDNFHWTRNKNTQFTEENQRKKSLRSAGLTTIISFRII